MTPVTTALVHLRGGGVSVLLDARGDDLPRILHWGGDLGPLDGVDAELWTRAVTPSAVDVAVPLAVLPQQSSGWAGRPGLSGSRSGTDWSPAFATGSIEVTHADGEAGGATLTITGTDGDAGLGLVVEMGLDAAGVLRLRHTVRNDGTDPYEVAQLAVTLPVAAVATEVLDLTGRWCRERHPQRRPLHQGAWVRESRHGRTGHDATLVLVAGTDGFGFGSGEVWGLHLGWSGDHSHWAERTVDGRGVLGAAELLAPGEIRLGPGETYATPWVHATWSGAGLDGLSRAYHRAQRARPHHPSGARPVVLNTWEAVYFDHRLDGLIELADSAAELGVERYVLDDGWFRHRRDDTAGLGDWYVDETVWPDGLTPLIDHVTGAGMTFGLWVEPEMVNADSDLYRAHPDWVLQARPGGRLPVPWRRQQVVDLTVPEAWGHILERLDALLTENDISFLKWDHNRDLIEAGSQGRPAVHAQTAAVYRLLDELRRRHPGVEIESCSSGGGRVDLGILDRTDRIWGSDTNDALERQTIQRWTGLLVAPELVGAHIGPPHSHTTGRVHGIGFRAVTAFFGHFGMEWDIRTASPEDRAVLTAVIAAYKQHRGLLHGGDVVRVDDPDPARYVHGVLAADRSEALLALVQLASPADQVPGPVRLPGLDPARSYRVEVLDAFGVPRAGGSTLPDWVTQGSVTVTGAVLARVGLPVPVLYPETALVLHVVAV